MNLELAKLIAADCYLTYLDFYNRGNYAPLPDYPFNELLEANNIADRDCQACLTREQLKAYFMYQGLVELELMPALKGESIPAAIVAKLRAQRSLNT